MAAADGDPASDVLATQSLFLSADAAVTPGRQAQLTALLQAVQRAGLPVRVAIIASPIDLGSVTELWRQPQNYARFLGQELGLVYRGPVLVVMPDGFGIYNVNGHERAALSGLRAPGLAALGGAALAAIGRIASALGHPVAVPRIATRGPTGAADVTAWVVFAIGVLAITAAWTASLRARPPARHA